jgi:hypothetical protein
MCVSASCLRGLHVCFALWGRGGEREVCGRCVVFAVQLLALFRVVRALVWPHIRRSGSIASHAPRAFIPAVFSGPGMPADALAALLRRISAECVNLDPPARPASLPSRVRLSLSEISRSPSQVRGAHFYCRPHCACRELTPYAPFSPFPPPSMCTCAAAVCCGRAAC